MTSTLLPEPDVADVRLRRGLAAGGVLGVATAVAGLAVVAGPRFGLLLFLAAVAVVAALLGLRDPVLATTYLLGASFLRLTVPDGVLPVDPFLPAFAGTVVAAWVWTRRHGHLQRAAGPVGVVMALYVVWNVVSAVTPHAYTAHYPLEGTDISVTRFILTGTVMPLAMFLVGRTVFTTERATRRLVWVLLACGAYSAFVSVMQFHGPAALVWPRFVLEDPQWEGRAVGVFNQPVVNGLVLVIGYLLAVLMASLAREPRVLRVLAASVAAASAYAVYLTHTRAVWLAFAFVVVAGALTAKGFRTGFVATLAVMAAGVTVNWASFTSADRSAGGVGSTNEIDDRLNMIATSVWAVSREPVSGWGIGRFPAVNTYHHQQWSAEVPWERGHGLASHFDLLGVAVELGIVGVVLWTTLLVLIGTQLVAAVRRLRHRAFRGRFALTALWCFGALLVTGLTVDLRFFDFVNIVVMLMAGAAVGMAHVPDGAPVGSEDPGP